MFFLTYETFLYESDDTRVVPLYIGEVLLIVK
jgi:hypothetical protein